ncbi:MAG: sensor histidine kinase [Galactobacter sp.]
MSITSDMANTPTRQSSPSSRPERRRQILLVAVGVVSVILVGFQLRSFSHGDAPALALLLCALPAHVAVWLTPKFPRIALVVMGVATLISLTGICSWATTFIMCLGQLCLVAFLLFSLHSPQTQRPTATHTAARWWVVTLVVYAVVLAVADGAIDFTAGWDEGTGMSSAERLFLIWAKMVPYFLSYNLMFLAISTGLGVFCSLWGIPNSTWADRFERIRHPKHGVMLIAASAVSVCFVLNNMADNGIDLEWVAVLVLAAALPVSIRFPRLAAIVLAVGSVLTMVANYLAPYDGVRTQVLYLSLAAIVIVVRQPPGRLAPILVGVFLAVFGALALTPYFADSPYVMDPEPGSSLPFLLSESRRVTWPPVFVLLLFLSAVPILIALLLRYVDAYLRARAISAKAANQLKQEELQRKLSEQRSEISGDVHDVLAHSLTVILAQSQAAALLHGEARTRALETVTQVARSSLSDVRSLIERLDEPENPSQPAPNLDDIPTLLSTFTTAGLPVTLEEFGEHVTVESSTGLAAYRIVQESLTNALKHGGAGQPCRVVLDWRGSEPALCLRVSSALDADAPHPGGGTGHGIEGMRIRAAVAGGWMTVGPDGDSWRVFVSLPTQPTPASAEGASSRTVTSGDAGTTAGNAVGHQNGAAS